jgi:hypothetical protein
VRLDRRGQSAKRGGKFGISNLVEHRTTLLREAQDPRSGEVLKMARDDREINRAACGDLTHTARPTALRDTADEPSTRGVAKGLEERWIEQVVEHTAAGGRLMRVARWHRRRNG